MHHERDVGSKKKNPLFFFLQLTHLFFFFYIFSCIFASCRFHPLGLMPSFFPSLWLLPCLRQGLPWGQRWQHNKAPGRAHRLDTRCIQLTRSSVSTSPHAQETHTHDPVLTDLTPPDLHPDGPSSTSQRERRTDLRRLKRCQLLIPGRIPVAVPELLPPTMPLLRKPKEKMISFQLDEAQGNFPAVFTDSEIRLSPVHMCAAEKLSSGSISVMDVHERRCLCPLPPPSRYPPRNCNSPGRRKNMDQAALSGCNCRQRHIGLVYKTTGKIAL